MIRNNVFEDTRCATYVVDCGSGGEDPEEFCEDLEIHGNVFHADCPVVMNLESTQRPRIYNNVFDITGEVTVLSHVSGERRSHNAWFFNNTITCSANCADAGSFRFQDTDNRFFNNLFAFFAPGPASLISGCAAFGGGSGPDFDNNFLYRSSGTTSLPSCTAGSANSTTYATNPSFIDAAGGNFDIGAGSPAAGFGTSMGAPSVDFDGRPRPNPPSAGAFDVN